MRHRAARRPPAPVEVPVPPLTGLPQATAEGLLDRLGLTYRVVYGLSELPPGTVVSTEPGAGTLVSTDDEVLVVVSGARPSSGRPEHAEPDGDEHAVVGSSPHPAAGADETDAGQ
ncbi:PASTA domain-containing protein [Micromonospora sp. M12]